MSLNSAVSDPSSFPGVTCRPGRLYKNLEIKRSPAGENTKFLEIKSMRWCDMRSRHRLLSVGRTREEEEGGQPEMSEVCQVVS